VYLKEYLTYAFMTLVTVAVLCIVIDLSGFRIADEVLVDGQTIGFVQEKSEVEDAISDIKSEISIYNDEISSSKINVGTLDNSCENQPGGEISYDKEPVFISRIVSAKKLASKKEIKAKLMSGIEEMVDCYAICADDSPVFGVSSLDCANKVLEDFKAQAACSTADCNLTVEFDKKLTVKEQFLPFFMVKSASDGVSELLNNEVDESEIYECKDDDTLWGIARDHDTTVDDILAANAGLTEVIGPGKKICLHKKTPIVNVKVTKDIEYNEEIPFDTQNIEDSDVQRGKVKVVTPGQNGEKRVFAKVVLNNGKEISRDVVKVEPIRDPQTQVQRVNTKKSKTPVYVASGRFLNPAGGVLTSRFGMRWGRRHEGIDIGGSYNAPIKAADGGTVTYAGWMSGYGNYITIDHENGYTTGYGHLSQISVKCGQHVSKGQVIGKMGSTGHSTGVHLHFEVKKNGVFTDPLKYVSY
jgi:murein DD-endopeptidase MepM/ murein hydrolase activator NlpD